MVVVTKTNTQHLALNVMGNTIYVHSYSLCTCCLHYSLILNFLVSSVRKLYHCRNFITVNSADFFLYCQLLVVPYIVTGKTNNHSKRDLLLINEKRESVAPQRADNASISCVMIKCMTCFMLNGGREGGPHLSWASQVAQ